MTQLAIGRAPVRDKDWRTKVTVEMSDRWLPARMRIRRVRSSLRMLASRHLSRNRPT